MLQEAGVAVQNLGIKLEDQVLEVIVQNQNLEVQPILKVQVVGTPTLVVMVENQEEILPPLAVHEVLIQREAPSLIVVDPVVRKTKLIIHLDLLMKNLLDLQVQKVKEAVQHLLLKLQKVVNQDLNHRIIKVLTLGKITEGVNL